MLGLRYELLHVSDADTDDGGNAACSQRLCDGSSWTKNSETKKNKAGPDTTTIKHSIDVITFQSFAAAQFPLASSSCHIFILQICVKHLHEYTRRQSSEHRMAKPLIKSASGEPKTVEIVGCIRHQVAVGILD